MVEGGKEAGGARKSLIDVGRGGVILVIYWQTSVSPSTSERGGGFTAL